MKHQTAILKAPDGQTLFTQSWTPDQPGKGTIVLVHGLAEHSGRYTHVAEYFVQQGYSVHALDHRGHGQSRGQTFGYFERFSLLHDDLYLFVESVRSLGRSGPLFMVGHSMGGLLALYYTIRHQGHLKGLITSGALLDAGVDVPGTQVALARFLSQVAPKMGMVDLDSNTLSKDPAVVSAYDNDPNVYRGKLRARVGSELIAAVNETRNNLGKITLPILCLHGAQDRLVKPSSTQYIYDHVGSVDKTIKIYDGLHHEIFNEPEKARVLADVWVWLASHQGTGELKAPAVAQQGS